MTNRFSRIALFSGKMLVAPLVLAGLVVVAPAPVAAQAEGDPVVEINGNLYPESAFTLDTMTGPAHHHALDFINAVPFTGSLCPDPGPGGGPGGSDGFGFLTFFPFSSSPSPSSGTSSGTGGLTGEGLAALTGGPTAAPGGVASPFATPLRVQVAPDLRAAAEEYSEDLPLDELVLILFGPEVVHPLTRYSAASTALDIRRDEFRATDRGGYLWNELGRAGFGTSKNPVNEQRHQEASDAYYTAQSAFDAVERQAFTEAAEEARRALASEGAVAAAIAPAAGGAPGATPSAPPAGWIDPPGSPLVITDMTVTPLAVQAADTATLGVSGGTDLTEYLQIFLGDKELPKKGEYLDLGPPLGPPHDQCNHISTPHPGDEMCILSLRQD